MLLVMAFALLLPLQQACTWYHLIAEQHEWDTGSHTHVVVGHTHSGDHHAEDPDHQAADHDDDHGSSKHGNDRDDDSHGHHSSNQVPDHDHHVEDHLKQESLRLPSTVNLTVHLVAMAPEAPIVSVEVQETSRVRIDDDAPRLGHLRGAPPPLRAPPTA